MELQAKKREQFGRAVKQIRAEGIIPAELYGHGTENQHLSINEKEFTHVLNEAGESTIIDLVVDKETHPVLIKDIHYHPVTDVVLNIDFYRVKMDEKITTTVELDFIGESSAVIDLGGVLVKSVSELEVGSWDLLHIGHVRYLMQAKAQGDILIVGVDSDRAIKKYKGDLRPVVPEDERQEMLSYQSCVDFITPLKDVDAQGKWQYKLLRDVGPDVFVAVKDSYPPHQIKEIKKHSKKVVVLPRQATRTSTSRMIQHTVKRHLDQMYDILEKNGRS